MRGGKRENKTERKERKEKQMSKSFQSISRSLFEIPSPLPIASNPVQETEAKIHLIAFVETQEICGRLEQLSCSSILSLASHSLELSDGVQQELKVSQSTDGVLQMGSSSDQTFDVRTDLLNEDS